MYLHVKLQFINKILFLNNSQKQIYKVKLSLQKHLHIISTTNYIRFFLNYVIDIYEHADNIHDIY